MTPPVSIYLPLLLPVAALLQFAARPLSAQVDLWHIGGGGLTWTSQAMTQSGALEVGTGLQPLELEEGQSLVELLRDSGQKWLNGQPEDFTLAGQPRTWSNDGLFNQLAGPLDLVDGDPTTSSGGVFKASRNQSGAAFFWDLGAPFPINRIRFFPDPDDPDAFLKAFDVLVNDGENFNDIKRPEYELLRRVEGNRDRVVDLEFAPLQGRFLQLVARSKTAFNLAEFEVFGKGLVPVASYLSELHSFGAPVNFGQVRLHATRLQIGTEAAEEPPQAILQMRTGADDEPRVYFRRNRDTGSQEEVSAQEYNNRLPRRALFRRDPATGDLLEELDRASYLDLPISEQGPVRDYVRGDIRADVDNWSAWSQPLVIDSTGSIATPVNLPGPREFMQFRLVFRGDAENAIRIDTFRVEFSPALVSAARGEVALADEPYPANGVVEVEGGVDTTFIYDIRTDFDAAALEGYRGLRVEAFPPPVYQGLWMGDPLVPVEEAVVTPTAAGFDVTFAPVTRQNNQPLRVGFRMRVLEHNTPVNAWLLGAGDVPPHPIAPGDAGPGIGTGVISVFSRQSKPTVDTDLSTGVITPNGDGANDAVTITLILAQFSGDVDVDVDVFDVAGRRVRRLSSGGRPAGAYDLVWDGADDEGQVVVPGVYVLRLAIDTDAQTFHRLRTIGVAY